MTAMQVVPAGDDPVHGVHWIDGDGATLPLASVVERSDKPAPAVLKAHLDSLDQTMIAVIGDLGEVLGGGREPASGTERANLRTFHLTLDRLVADYVDGLAAARLTADTVSGQVVGTAALVGFRARVPLGLTSPPPLQGKLDDPGVGVVAGYGELVTIGDDEPWRGAQWIVRTDDGRRLPASLTMLMLDSSGVDQQTTLDTHRTALSAATSAADAVDNDIDRIATAAGAVDHLLVDWLMAHRYEPETVAIRIDPDRIDDAWMIVSAASASIRLRRMLDPTT